MGREGIWGKIVNVPGRDFPSPSSSMYPIPSRKEHSPLHKGRNGISRNLLLYFFLFSISAASPNRPDKKSGSFLSLFFPWYFSPSLLLSFPSSHHPLSHSLLSMQKRGGEGRKGNRRK